MKRLKWSVALATLAGLAIALWTIGAVGFRQIAVTVAHAGIGGFLLFTASYMAVLVALGAAWATSMRERGDLPLAQFVWARAVREAASDLLPFSQIGGLFLGVRVLVEAGASPVRIYAAMIVDLATELVAQLLLVLFGLAAAGLLLAGPGDDKTLHRLVLIGVSALAALTIAFVALQRPALALVSRLAERLVPAAGAVIDAVRSELALFAQRRAAILPPFLWNALAWLLSVFSAWVGLHVLGADVPPERVLALEVLIYTVRSGAFLVPGALGVQEASYALLAPVFGIDQEAALALSLLKRARDVAVGLPTLLVWQALQMIGRPAASE